MVKDWTLVKNELQQLYHVENRPLREVMRLLQDKHGFTASLRAYKTQLQKWSFTKYNTTRLRPYADHPQQTECPPIYAALSNETDLAMDPTSRGLVNSNTNDCDDVGSNMCLNPSAERLHAAVTRYETNQLPTSVEATAGAGALTNAIHERGQTSLHRAIQTVINRGLTPGIIDTIEQLLQAGECPSCTDFKGNTPLHSAVYGIRLETTLGVILAIFLKQNYNCLSFRNTQGFTVFSKLWHQARRHLRYYTSLNSPTIATDTGGDVQLQDMQECSSFEIFFKTLIIVIKAAILSGAPAQIVPGRAYRMSDRGSNIQSCSLLGPNRQEENGSCILHFIASTGVSGKVDVALADLFLQHGADINSKDQNGETPLMKALRYRRLDPEMVSLARHLVENGADLGARDSDDNCTIWDAYRAFAAGSPETFLWLVYTYGRTQDRCSVEVKDLLWPIWTESPMKKTWDRASRRFPFHMQPKFKSPQTLMRILKWLAKGFESLAVVNSASERFMLHSTSRPSIDSDALHSMELVLCGQLQDMERGYESPSAQRLETNE